MIFSRDFNCLWAFEVHFKFNVFCGIDLSGFDEFCNLIHVCVDVCVHVFSLQVLQLVWT